MDLNPRNYFLERQGRGTISKIILLSKAVSTIGRADNNDHILNSTYISRNHAEIRIKTDKIFFKDLGSSNGTYINDSKLSNAEEEVKDGDMIGWGCSPSAFNIDPELLPADLIYFYKVRVPDCIDLDSDSDATDINELCDDLANNPGVDGFYNNPSSPLSDSVICVSSDEEVEVDQEWAKRVSKRSSSPVPVSLKIQAMSPNPIQASKEQFPMVVLPGSVRKSLVKEAVTKEKNHSKSATNEVISVPAIETTVEKKNISECFVVIKKLSQEEIENFLKEDDKPVEKPSQKRKKQSKSRLINIQEQIKNLCESDSDTFSDNIPLKHLKKSKKFNTELECNMKTPMKITIRKKSTDCRAEIKEIDHVSDQSNFTGTQIEKKQRVMTRRHSVHESKSDLSKENISHDEEIKVLTRTVPKRRASMSNNIFSPPEKKLKPDRAIEIQALPNKQLRQRSNCKYNEKSTNQITSNQKVTSKSASDEKWKKDRNEKIRKVAENQCNKISVEEPPAAFRVKTMTKPVAKMTMNNRGSFLTENIAERIQKYAPTTSKSISKTTIVANAPNNCNSSDIKITIEQFRNNHLNADTTSTDMESQGVCNNVQFYQHIIPNSECKKIQQRKLTITLDDEELEHQRQLQQSIAAGFYDELPLNPPTYSPSVASNPVVQNVYNSSPIPSPSSRVPQIVFETPTNKTVLLKSILTPVDTTVKKDKRVSFNKMLVSIREIPKSNQSESGDEEMVEEHFDAPVKIIEPFPKILHEILSWCPSWLENKNEEMNHHKKWQFRPMLQSYESLNQYKQILSPIINMELLTNITSKYDNLINGNKHKWTTFKSSFCSKISGLLFCFQIFGDIKDNRKNYSVGTLIIVKIIIQRKETKLFGYISEQIDRNNKFKVQCCMDDINYSLVSSANKVDVLPIMYLRSELKSLLSLNQITETSIMKNILKPELNKPVVKVTPDRDGLLNLNESQSEKGCRIVEDLLYNKDAKVIALQGGPGTGKTKVIVACVMKIIRKSKNSCRILICSKSNACINEITVHLNSLSIENKFRLVRFGNIERISKAVVQVSLNHLANQYISNAPAQNMSFQKAKIAIIQMADVVCTTINSSYELINEYKKHFDVCFIDEASQFTDADLIIPVQSGFKKLVLVGDSKQLQPIVNSRKLKNLNFEISLFERMNKICEFDSTKNPVLTLTIQHRMNPEIFKFPNQYFYNNEISTRLSHSPNIALKPYMVFGLKFDQNMTQDMSCYNIGEIKFCYHLCESLLTILPPNLTIAIITPYSRQREEVLKYFKDGERTNEQKSRVEVYTIDSAQGLENDIVIMSVVKTRGIGFLSNPQRLNVALTRAKKALYICGNFSSLRNDSMWKALLDDSKHRKCYRDIDSDAPSYQIISSIKRDNR